MIGLRALQLVADSSILAYHGGVCHLLGFNDSIGLNASSFHCLFAPFFFLEPGLEPHCSLCALDIQRGFTTSGALGVLLGELGLYVDSVSLLGVIPVHY